MTSCLRRLQMWCILNSTPPPTHTQKFFLLPAEFSRSNTRKQRSGLFFFFFWRIRQKQTGQDAKAWQVPAGHRGTFSIRIVRNWTKGLFTEMWAGLGKPTQWQEAAAEAVTTQYGLNCVPSPPKKVCCSPHPQNLTMWPYLARVFAEIIKFKRGHYGIIVHMTGVLTKGGDLDIDAQRGCHMKTKAEIRAMLFKPKMASKPRKRGQNMDQIPLSWRSEGTSPTETLMSDH